MKTNVYQQIVEQMTGIHFIPEYKFCTNRRWRFDLAEPTTKIAIEIEGGIWVGGRHVSGKGFKNDLEKYNKAAELGWAVLRYTPEQIMKNTSVYEQIKTLFNNRKNIKL